MRTTRHRWSRGADDDELHSRPDPLENPPAVTALRRFKSAYKLIFEKHGKDFTDSGDEVDLRTGEVVVDNCHIQSLSDDDESLWSASFMGESPPFISTIH